MIATRGEEKKKEVMINICLVYGIIDDLLERTDKVLKYEDPSPRSVENLRHWLNDEACLARNETRYLEQTEDLMGLKSAGGREASKVIQNLIEEALIWTSEIFNKVR